MNIEHTLYVALKRVMTTYVGCETTTKIAQSALAEYELMLGPLPDWATGHNVDHEYVLGAQLFTKDGRRHGNAHIVGVGNSDLGIDGQYDVMTDAGSLIENMQLREVQSGWEAGDFISDPADVIKRFGRERNMNMLLEPVVKPPILGHYANGNPIHPIGAGMIASAAVVSCCACNAVIRGMGGPIIGALCPACWEDK